MNEQEKPQSTATVSVDVKVYPLEDKGNLKAFADVTLGGCFAVKGVKVMEGEKGPCPPAPMPTASTTTQRTPSIKLCTTS